MQTDFLQYIFQAIDNLLTQNLGFFDAMGQNLFRSFATILVVSSLAFGQTKKTDHTITLDEGAKPGIGTLADCSWFAGYWRSTAAR